jgi:hypothetical protein
MRRTTLRLRAALRCPAATWTRAISRASTRATSLTAATPTRRSHASRASGCRPRPTSWRASGRASVTTTAPACTSAIQVWRISPPPETRLAQYVVESAYFNAACFAPRSDHTSGHMHGRRGLCRRLLPGEAACDVRGPVPGGPSPAVHGGRGAQRHDDVRRRLQLHRRRLLRPVPVQVWKQTRAAAVRCACLCAYRMLAYGVVDTISCWWGTERHRRSLRPITRRMACARAAPSTTALSATLSAQVASTSPRPPRTRHSRATRGRGSRRRTSWFASGRAPASRPAVVSTRIRAISPPTHGAHRARTATQATVCALHDIMYTHLWCSVAPVVCRTVPYHRQYNECYCRTPCRHWQVLRNEAIGLVRRPVCGEQPDVRRQWPGA